jgi:TPR repeat protein
LWAKKAAQARALFEKACNSGHNPGCDNLGQLLSNGLGVRNDKTCASHPDL